MAFSLKITSARQCSMGLAPQPGGGYVFVVDYAVQATVGGSGSGSGGGSGKDGVVQDVLIGGAQQRVSAPVQTGKPMLTPAQVAALIRADCQAVFGGQPDKVLIDGAAL